MSGKMILNILLLQENLEKLSMNIEDLLYNFCRLLFLWAHRLAAKIYLK